MYSAQRCFKLFFVLLVLASVNVRAQEGEIRDDEGGVVEDMKDAAESVVDYIENIAEDVAEAARVKDVKHMVEEAVEDVAEAAEAMKSTTANAAKSLLDNMKTKVSGAVDVVVTQSKSVIERCKKMSKADVKKVAAAAVGIWGVAVGVGYLTKGTPPLPSPTGRMFATSTKKK